MVCTVCAVSVLSERAVALAQPVNLDVYVIAGKTRERVVHMLHVWILSWFRLVMVGCAVALNTFMLGPVAALVIKGAFRVRLIAVRLRVHPCLFASAVREEPRYEPQLGACG